MLVSIRRIASALIAALAIVTLAACSSTTPGKGRVVGPKSPLPSVSQGSSEPTETPTFSGKGDPAFCAKIVESMGKLGELAGDAGDMTKLQDALAQMSAFYKDLHKGAPDELKQPISHMVTLLDAAKKALADPGAAEDMQKALGDLMSQLPADAQKISEYIASSCGGQ